MHGEISKTYSLRQTVVHPALGRGKHPEHGHRMGSLLKCLENIKNSAHRGAHMYLLEVPVGQFRATCTWISAVT